MPHFLSHNRSSCIIRRSPQLGNRLVSKSTAPSLPRVVKFNRRDAKTQRNARNTTVRSASPRPSLVAASGGVANHPATWTAWLGRESPRRQGQRVPSRASPRTPVPFPPFSSPAFCSFSCSKSPKVTLIKTHFRGVAGGHTRPHASAHLKRQTKKLPSQNAPEKTKSAANSKPKPLPTQPGSEFQKN